MASEKDGPRKEILQMDADEALGALHADASGLTQEEAQGRLKLYGPNEIAQKRPNPALDFLSNFWGPSAWMLEIIILLSWILRKDEDLYIVGGLLVFNAILGFAEKRRAVNAVEALKARLQVNARVLRDREWGTTEARNLVPGDIVRMRAGDFVPADVLVLTGQLSADQSSLTGESQEVEKTPGDALYSGSVVKQGEAQCVVALTGAKTNFGKTAHLVQISHPKMHTEDVTASLTKSLLAIVFSLLAVVFAYSVLMGHAPLDTLPLMLVLLLGAVPVALPTMFSISMAIASMDLVKKGILVTRLSAPDDAASMDILCVDKTGTITMNQMAVVEVIPLGGHTQKEVLLFGMLASHDANQDPIDLAFMAEARRMGLGAQGYSVEEFVPFEPKRRRTEARVRHGRSRFRVMKGAVTVIADLCGLENKAKQKMEEKMHELARKGYRSLAVAKSAINAKPEIIGIVALHDPPKPEAKKAIEDLKAMGVSVKVLTGDAEPIAEQITKEVGLTGKIVRLAHLKEFFAQEPERAAELAETSGGFAEIYPGDKHLIVRTLQDRKHIVGMTGDGVNDAPALKQAEVGIAVSNASDVAKGAAIVVLDTKDLSQITELIRTGRMMFQRINTWILNKISRTVLKTCFVAIALVLTGKFVISSSAMLLMIFMTDFVKVTLSTDNVRVSKKPDVWNMPQMTKLAAVLGIVMVAEALALLFIGWTMFGLGGNDAALHTFSFEILFFFAIFSVLVARERGNFWDSAPSKVFMGAIIIDSAAAVVFATLGMLGLAPIPLSMTAFVIAYSFVFSLVVNDRIKLFAGDRLGWAGRLL